MNDSLEKLIDDIQAHISVDACCCVRAESWLARLLALVEQGKRDAPR